MTRHAYDQETERTFCGQTIREVTPDGIAELPESVSCPTCRERMQVRCSECGQIFIDDYEFETHECLATSAQEEELMELDFDLLRALAWGDITEEEAWAKYRERRARSHA